MVTTPLKIVRKQISDGDETQYIAQDVKTIIDKFTVTNTTALNVTFTVNLPNFGDLPGDTNNILDGISLDPSETYACPEIVGQILEQGDYINTNAGASSSLTISVTGREIS